MNWENYIHSDPDILVGKPVIKGTRLSVEFVLSLLSAGWTEQQIFENYPTLNQNSLRAVFAAKLSTGDRDLRGKEKGMNETSLVL